MFTEWPDRAELDKPFVISVLGNLPKGVTVRIPKDLTIHNRRVILRRIKRLSEIKNSRVLFIAASEAHRADDIIDYVNGRPILTVGDTQGLGYKGVIINLFIKEKRVKFEINHGASKRASLQMHSQLFAIGKVVGRDMRHEPATGEENNRKNGDAPK